MRFWQLQSDLQPFEQPSVYHFCCITVNIFGVPTATKTNNLWSLASPFLWFEDIIQKSFTLTNGTDKGQFQRKQKSFLCSLKWFGRYENQICCKYCQSFFHLKRFQFHFCYEFLNHVKIYFVTKVTLHTLWLFFEFWVLCFFLRYTLPYHFSFFLFITLIMTCIT